MKTSELVLKVLLGMGGVYVCTFVHAAAAWPWNVITDTNAATADTHNVSYFQQKMAGLSSAAHCAYIQMRQLSIITFHGMPPIPNTNTLNTKILFFKFVSQ